MNRKINGSNRGRPGNHELTGKLVIHHISLWVKEIAAIINEAKGKGITVALRPGMDVLRKLVERFELEYKAYSHYHNKNNVGMPAC